MLVVKNPLTNVADVSDAGSIFPVGKIPWRRAWQPAPLFLPGKSYEQRNVVGYRPWGHKKSDTAERACTHT